MDDNLVQLERELTQRPRSATPAELRARVLRDVQRKLNEEHIRGKWLFAASVAAAFLIWFNLSWFAARETPVLGPHVATEISLNEIAEQLMRLVPDMSQQEAKRQALLLRSCSGWRPASTAFPVPFALETK